MMKIKLTHSQKVRATVCFIGTSEHLHVPIGTVVATACVVWIIPSLLFNRKLIGFGTVVMFCFGFFVDMWNFILHSIFAESTFIMLDESLILRFLLTILGICLLAFAASFYMVADMGLAPYDAIPFVIEKMAKMKFKYARMILCLANSSEFVARLRRDRFETLSIV